MRKDIRNECHSLGKDLSITYATKAFIYGILLKRLSHTLQARMTDTKNTVLMNKALFGLMGRRGMGGKHTKCENALCVKKQHGR